MSVEFDVRLTKLDGTVSNKHYVMCGCARWCDLMPTLAQDFGVVLGDVLLKDGVIPSPLTPLDDCLPIRYGVIDAYEYCS